MNRTLRITRALALLPLTLVACSGAASTEHDLESAPSSTSGDALAATADCAAANVASVHASADDGNVPANVLDHDFGTRWSALGKGSSIVLDLGASTSVCRADIGFYRGNVRVTTFTIDVSADGTTFSRVFSGKSSGKATGYETFTFTPKAGRYVRVVVNGNTENDWASLTEVKPFGAASAPPPPPPPPSGGRPGPTNTGVPAGTVLTPSSGDLTITTPNAVIDAMDIHGCVSVRAANVTIKRTRITCDSYYPVIVQSGSLLIEDTEIAAETSGGNATSGIAFTDYTARRVNVHGSADGLKADSNVLIEDSWIHDLYLGDGDHADGVQGTGGTNVTVRHNFIDIVNHGKGHGGQPNSCFQVGTEDGTNGSWLIEQNFLYGGGWVVHFDGGGGNNVIQKNRFGRGSAQVAGQPNYPEYGPIAITRDASESGNVWDDDGSKID